MICCKNMQHLPNLSSDTGQPDTKQKLNINDSLMMDSNDRVYWMMSRWWLLYDVP